MTPWFYDLGHYKRALSFSLQKSPKDWRILDNCCQSAPSRRKDGSIDGGWMSPWGDGWKYEWTDGWIDRWMDGWTN